MKRVVHLASQWEKHRTPLVDEHRRLKEMCSHHDVSPAVTRGRLLFQSNTFISFSLYFLQLESSRKLSEIKSLHDKIRVSTEEAKKKEELHRQLVRDCFVLDCQHDRRGVNSCRYTRVYDVFEKSIDNMTCARTNRSSYLVTVAVWKTIRATYESFQ